MEESWRQRALEYERNWNRRCQPEIKRRLEKLYAETLMELQKLGENVQKEIGEFLKTAYEDRYYHGIYDLASVGKLAIPAVKVDSMQLEKILAQKWSGENYSTRLWKNIGRFEKTLKETIMQGIHRGLSVERMAKFVERKTEAAFKGIETLILTEMNFVQNRAALDSIKSAGLQEYEFIAVLDNKTSSRCKGLDGTTHLVEEYSPGTNAPPMHVRCRSTICAVLSDKSKSLRAAKLGGENISIPAEMKYADFKRVYIDKTQTLEDWQKNKAAENNLLQAKPENIIERVRAKGVVRRLANDAPVTPIIIRPKGEQKILAQFDLYDVGAKTDAQRLAQINPNYSGGEYQWTHNCQRCVVAWELVQRGYNVTAKPLANDLIGDNIAAWKFNNKIWNLDSEVRLVLSKGTFKEKIAAAFNAWGIDARTMIVVTWKNGEKHAFTARKVFDKIIYEDPQYGKIRDIDKTLAACSDKHGKIFFMRIDNREFTDAVVYAVKNLEE